MMEVKQREEAAAIISTGNIAQISNESQEGSEPLLKDITV